MRLRAFHPPWPNRAAGFIAVLLAVMLVSLLPSGCSAGGEGAGSRESAAPTGTAGPGLRGAFERVLASEGEARATGELALARRVADASAEAAALYEDETRPAARSLWLRLMGLSGQRAFLPLLHGAMAGSVSGTDANADALDAVLLLSDPASAPVMRSLLREDDPARAVAALRYFKAHPQILRREDLAPLFGRSDPTLRLNLLDLLPRFIDDETFALCRTALGQPPPAGQVRAARCLGRMGAERPERRGGVLQALTEVFPRVETEVRLAIVAAVGRGGGAGREAWLSARLEEPPLRVALAALVALQREALPGTVPRLMVLIDEARGPIPRNVLIKSLGLHRDVRAVPFLGTRLAATDTGRADKLVLLEALGDVGALEGQAHLAPYLSDYDPELRETARRALQRIAGRQLQQGSAGKKAPERR